MQDKVIQIIIIYNNINVYTKAAVDAVHAIMLFNEK